MIADLAPDAIYEPWQPAEGQRVRVRISGECPANHALAYDGQIGVVDYVFTPEEAYKQGDDPHDEPLHSGHFYGVDFDRAISPTLVWFCGLLGKRGSDWEVFCALELEPVS